MNKRQAKDSVPKALPSRNLTIFVDMKTRPFSYCKIYIHISTHTAKYTYIYTCKHIYHYIIFYTKALKSKPI